MKKKIVIMMVLLLTVVGAKAQEVENPDVAYFKWDCNSVITNIYSPYHKENQGNFYIDHVRKKYLLPRKVS